MSYNKRKESKIAYKIMIYMYKIQDFFNKPDNRLLNFAIKKDFIVADFGCGPGRYIKQASELVGETGRVYAVDINKTALEHVNICIDKFNLRNVVPVLNINNIDDNCVDVIYALDMFHQIESPKDFLEQIYRIIKPNGWFILEDGHQQRATTIIKIQQSDLWEIEQENKRFVKLIPINKS